MKTRLLTLPLTLLLVACGSGTPAQPTQAPPVQPAPATTVANVKPAAEPALPASTATGEPAPTSAPVPTATPEAAVAAAPIGDARELILNAMRKQLNSGPFRNTTTITADGINIEGKGEFIPPDRLRVVTEMNGQAIEQVHIGDKSWSKVGGTWTAETTKGGSIDGMINAEFVEAMIATITEPKLIGPELLNGRAVIVVSYIADMSKAPNFGLPGKQNTTLWIGATDGLLYKQEIKSEGSTTTQVIEYDAGIVIEPPAK